ncbi:MAG: disulfide bond formation protein B [Geminicoccaceae bacterium]
MPSSFYHPKNASLLLALAAIAILASVFVMQYGFGLAPCRMCIWQRWPFAALAAIGLIGAFVWPRVMLSIAVAVLLVSIGLGGYHVGVEQGLIPLPAGCSTVGEAGSVEELKAMLKAAPPSCDQVTANFFGLSLAGWNMVASAILAIFTLIILTTSRRQASTLAHQT